MHERYLKNDTSSGTQPELTKYLIYETSSLQFTGLAVKSQIAANASALGTQGCVSDR